MLVTIAMATKARICGCLDRVDCGSIEEIEKVVKGDEQVTYRKYKQYKKICKCFYVSHMNGILVCGVFRGILQALIFVNLWINHQQNGDNCEELNEPSHLFYILCLCFANFIDMQTLYHELLVCDLLNIGLQGCGIRWAMAILLAIVFDATLGGFIFSLLGYFVAALDVVGTTIVLLAPVIALIIIRIVVTLRLSSVVGLNLLI